MELLAFGKSRTEVFLLVDSVLDENQVSVYKVSAAWRNQAKADSHTDSPNGLPPVAMQGMH